MATKKDNKKPALFKVSQWISGSSSDVREEEMILTDVEGGGPTKKIIADFGDNQRITITLEDRSTGPALLLHTDGTIGSRIAVFPVVSNEIEVCLIDRR